MTDAKSAQQAKDYYTQSLRKEGYYLKGSSQEVAGSWQGRATQALGLSGPVTEREFFDLCDNIHPVLKTQLTPRNLSNRRVGMDITFARRSGCRFCICCSETTGFWRCLNRASSEQWP